MIQFKYIYRLIKKGKLNDLRTNSNLLNTFFFLFVLFVIGLIINPRKGFEKDYIPINDNWDRGTYMFDKNSVRCKEGEDWYQNSIRCKGNGFIISKDGSKSKMSDGGYTHCKRKNSSSIEYSPVCKAAEYLGKI